MPQCPLVTSWQVYCRPELHGGLPRAAAAGQRYHPVADGRDRRRAIGAERGAVGDNWLPGATLSFLASDVSTTLRFRDISTSGGFANIALDAVSLTGAAAAVPEPVSWAMMVGGFGLVGGTMRRRQKVSTALNLA